MSNLPDYEGYEQLGGFTAPQLAAYRLSLLRKTVPQRQFIHKHVYQQGRPLSVVEIGSGNGRLFIDLAASGLLRCGVGMDTSVSRVAFARRWAKDEGYRDFIAFHVGNVLNWRRWEEDPTIPSILDLAVCITGCFQYFYPISPEGPATVLEYMRASAEYSLFELYKRPPMGRTWHQLDKADRWRYILDDYEDVGDWVRHTKTFISADGKEDVRVENLAYYTSEVFLSHLRKAGFTELLWLGEDAERIVVLVK